MFPITQQQACGRPGSSHQPEDSAWLGQQNTGKSKMLLFRCLVWQTLIAGKLVFLRRVSAHKGAPGLRKDVRPQLSLGSGKVLSETVTASMVPLSIEWCRQQQSWLLDLCCPSSALLLSILWQEGLDSTWASCQQLYQHGLFAGKFVCCNVLLNC